MTMEKITKEFEFSVLEDMSKIPDEVKAKLKKGDMVLHATTLTSDFLPEKWLYELADDSINNRVIWRHKDPEVGGRFYGRNIYNKVVDGEGKNAGKKVIDTYFRLFGGAKNSYNDKLQQYIQLKDKHDHPVSISKSFVINRCPKNGEIERVFALEDSITYIPKCKTCEISEVYNMEEDKSKEMIDKEIKKLQDDLNSATIQLEEKSNIVEEMTAKIEKYEADIKSRDDEKKSLEDKVVQLSDSINKLEAKMVQKEREPYIKRLEELETDKYLYEIIKERPIPEIEARIKKLEKAKDGPQVVTTTIEEEAIESLEGDEAPKDVGIKAFRNNPTLAREIATMKAKDKELGLGGVW